MAEASTSTSTSASASTATAAGSGPAAGHATFIESSSAYHIGRSERDSDREDDNDDEDDDDDDDDEKLFAELDKELDMMEDESNFDHSAGDAVASFDMAEFRERRMEELRQEIAAHKASSERDLDGSAAQHTSTASMKGLLTELTNEKDIITLSSSERQVAIHFFHPKFPRCALLDRHLTVLARLHPSTLFLKANVLNCPFLTQKLKVSVLPCLITFKDGISKDKIIGFEELGNSDKFSTGALEWRLGQSGIIDPRENRKPIFGFAGENATGESVGRGVVGAKKDDEDDFWDDE